MNNEIDSSNFRQVLSQDDQWREKWELNQTKCMITHSSGLKFTFARKPDGHGTQCDYHLLAERHFQFRDSDHMKEFSQLGLQAIFLLEELSAIVDSVSHPEIPQQSDSTTHNSDYVESLIKNQEWRSNWSFNREEGIVTHSSGLIFKSLKSTSHSSRNKTIEFTCTNRPADTDEEFNSNFKKLMPQALIILAEVAAPTMPTDLELEIKYDLIKSLHPIQQSRGIGLSQHKEHLLENDAWRELWIIDCTEAKAKHSNGVVFVLDDFNIVGTKVMSSLHCIQMPPHMSEDFHKYHEQLRKLGLEALMLFTEQLDLFASKAAKQLH